jgi:hypothetical protein
MKGSGEVSLICGTCRIMPPRWPSNASCCARRWPRPRAIIRRPPGPWGCSAPISSAYSPPSVSANATRIHPVSARLQAPEDACRASTGSRPAPARGGCTHPPPRRATPRGPTPGGSRLPPTARRWWATLGRLFVLLQSLCLTAVTLPPPALHMEVRQQRPPAAGSQPSQQ